MTDVTKIWRDMTPAEKGALLLAEHEGKVIQQHVGYWTARASKGFGDAWAYRVEPEPVRDQIVLYYDAGTETFSASWPAFGPVPDVLPTIIIETVDGKPASIRMEAL